MKEDMHSHDFIQCNLQTNQCAIVQCSGRYLNYGNWSSEMLLLFFFLTLTMIDRLEYNSIFPLLITYNLSFNLKKTNI